MTSRHPRLFYPRRAPYLAPVASAKAARGRLGQRLDFKRLKGLGVPLEGKIALARYGGPLRGIKVKNAHDDSMIGVVMFTDVADDGAITEANGFAAYPDGPARNPSSVQRGRVGLSRGPNDARIPIQN